MSDMTFGCLHQKSKSHRDQIKFNTVITSPVRLYFGTYLTLIYMGYFDYLFYAGGGGRKKPPLGLTLVFDFRYSYWKYEVNP